MSAQTPSPEHFFGSVNAYQRTAALKAAKPGGLEPVEHRLVGKAEAGVGVAVAKLLAFVEREVALMKRYWLWEVVWIIYGLVTSLSVAFIGIAAPAISGNAVDPATTSRFVLYLLVGTIAWRFMGLRAWHVVACLLFGFLLAATSAAPEIRRLVTAIIRAFSGH